MEEKKQNDKKQNLALLAIVAIVAIVSLVVVFNQKSVTVVPVMTQMPSDSEVQEQVLAGQADYVVAEEYVNEYLVGEALAIFRRLPQIKVVSSVPDLTEDSKRILKPSGISPPGESMFNVYVRSIEEETGTNNMLVEMCTSTTSHSDDIPHAYNMTLSSLTRKIVEESVRENPDAPLEGNDEMIFRERRNDRVRVDAKTYGGKDGFCFKVREPRGREISEPIKVNVRTDYTYNRTTRQYKWKTFDVYVGNEIIPTCSAGVIGGRGINACAFDVRVKMPKVTGGTSINILTPNGLEQWSRGREQTIKYTTSNLPAGSKVRFYLNKVDCAGDTRVGSAIGETSTFPGIFTWIPGNVISCAGGYKIEAVLINGTGAESATIKDTSDSPFSIIG